MADTDYWGLYQSAAARYGLDPRLLYAQGQVESSGNPRAVSSAGAQGLAQLMPDTAKALGVTDPFDPAQSIDAQARLMRENLDRYHDPDKALMAYHGGTDQENWGPLTQAYPQKVRAAMDSYSVIAPPIAGVPQQQSDLLNVRMGAPLQTADGRTLTGPEAEAYISQPPSSGLSGSSVPPAQSAPPVEVNSSPVDSLQSIPDPSPQAAPPDLPPITPRRDVTGFAQAAPLPSQSAAPQGFSLFGPNEDPTRTMALLNFGAGLLAGGRTPAEKMAAAAQGVSNAVKEGQTLDLARSRAAMLAQHYQALNGQAQQGQRYYAPDGTVFIERFNKMSGKTEFTNANTGETVPTIPKGSFRMEDSPYKTTNKGDATEQNAAITAARNAPQRIQLIDRFVDNAKNIAGPDAYNTVGRWLSQFTGQPLGKFDPANVSSAKQAVADMALNAAERMHGQGQISDSERKLLGDAVMSLDTNPGAIDQIASVLKAAEQRKMAMADAWVNAPAADKAAGFNVWSYKWMRDNASNFSGQPPKQSEATPKAPAPGTQPTVGSTITTTSGKTVKIIQ